MRTKLTPQFVKNAKAADGADRTVYWDAALEGFGLMVTATGHRSWVCQYRAKGISRRYTIPGKLTLAKARKRAKGVQGLVADGRDPVVEERRTKAEATSTLKAIAEDYLRREEKRGELRHMGERRRVLTKYIYPKLGGQQIDAIKRSDITRLLDHVEDAHGPVQADAVLAALRRLMNWYAGRGDDFRSPIVRGMARTRPGERARKRTLDDHELRAVWGAAGGFSGPYGYLVKFLLLTAVRLREASEMVRGELSANGREWTIPAARHKGKRDFLLPLSLAARNVLEAVRKIGRKGLVFTRDGERFMTGYSKAKIAFDKAVLAELRKVNPKAEPLPNWTNHDLRRTARSLMARAGVPPRHAEMALGHVVAGVEGVYDRHGYVEEKRQAYQALEVIIGQIVDPKTALSTTQRAAAADRVLTGASTEPIHR